MFYLQKEVEIINEKNSKIIYFMAFIINNINNLGTGVLTLSLFW